MYVYFLIVMHCVAHIIDIRKMVSGLLHKKRKTKNKMIGNKCPYNVCSQFSAAFIFVVNDTDLYLCEDDIVQVYKTCRNMVVTKTLDVIHEELRL